MLTEKLVLINLDPAIGAEINKIRPAIIVNDDSIGILPLKIIVPITDWKDRYNIAPWMVRIDPDVNNGLNKLSAVDVFQVRSISQERFIRRLGNFSEIKIQEILKAVLIVFGIGS